MQNVSQILAKSLIVGHKADQLGANDPAFAIGFPIATTLQRLALDADNGLQFGSTLYDSDLDAIVSYTNHGWARSDGTAAGSLDAAYNGGSTITMDTGALLLNVSADVAFTFDNVAGTAVTDAIKVVSTGTGAITDAIDVSAAAIVNAINIGANAIAGTNFSVDASGNVTCVGVAASGTVAAAAAMTVGTTLAVGGAATFASTLTIEGTVAIDLDNAAAFRVRRNGTSTTLFNIDSTSDAGDTQFTFVGQTTTGIGMSFTVANTTGSGLYIDGSTVTSGDVLKIKVVSATMTAAGSAISVVDGATEVFAVRDDGSVYSKATAEGTTAWEVVTGDVLIDDGDFKVLGGEVVFTSDANATGLTISNNTITTANALIDVASTSITTGALMRLHSNTITADAEVLEIISTGDATSTPKGITVTIADVTTGAARGLEITMAGATTNPKGIIVTMDAITTGSMVYLDNGGASLTSGYFLNCNDDGAVLFGVGANGNTIIAGTAAGTAAMTLTLGDLVLGDSDTSSITSANGTGTMFALTNTAGVIADNTAVLLVTAGGAIASGGNVLRVSATGTPGAGAIYAEFNFAGITDTNENVGLLVDATGKKVQALKLIGSPVAGSLALMTSGAALAADKATLEVVSSNTTNNGDSSVVRFQQTHASGAGYVAALLQGDVSEPFINFESTAGAGNSVDTTATTQGAIVGFVRVAINGTDVYLTACAAPSGP